MLGLNTDVLVYRVTSAVFPVHPPQPSNNKISSVCRAVDDEIEANIEEVFLPYLSSSSHSDGHRIQESKNMAGAWALLGLWEQSLKARLWIVSCSLKPSSSTCSRREGGGEGQNTNAALSRLGSGDASCSTSLLPSIKWTQRITELPSF